MKEHEISCDEIEKKTQNWDEWTDLFPVLRAYGHNIKKDENKREKELW